MPRIRKKTSNRQNTRDRKKISKHVAEHKKKERKASKKDVTWKSKKKADPGIPNSFIHKDKVLAEMAAEKRQEEEARLARREAAKDAARAQSPEEEETPGIQSILSATVSSRSKPKAAAEVEVEEEDMDIPDLIDTSLTTLQEVLDKADVVVQVVDARDIAGGRSKFIEDLVQEAGGKIVLLVNKIDRVPKETLQSWLKTISIPTFLFKSVLPAARASTSTQHIEPTVVLGRTELLEYLSTIKPAEKDADLHVALMGLPNVGKTSVLNSLLPAKAKHHETAPVLALNAASKNPQPTTKLPSETRIEHEGRGIRIIDTPGWDFADDDEEEEEDEDEEEEDEDVEVDEEKLAKWDKMAETMTGDLLRRNLGRVDRIKDIIPLANFIVSRSNAQDLMVAYNIPYFNDGDTMAFLTAVARSTGRLRKHNSPDLESAAKHLVRDWAQNTFPYYSTPKASGASSMEVDNASQPDMSAVLEACSSRKDMRKVGKGVIRFKGGEVDTREIVLDDDYTAGLAPSDDEDEDDEEEDEDVDDDDDDDDEELEVDDLDSDEEVIEGADFEVESASEGDEEEEEEEEVSEPEPEPVSRKLKRKADPVASPGEKKKPRTNKRVSFGGKLGATGSSEMVEKEVKSILKRDRNGDVKAAATVVKEAAPARKAVAAVVKEAPVKKAAPVAVSNGKAKKTKGTYDFSAHF